MGMTVYLDLVSGDEVISSSYDLIDKDDVVYEVNCRTITVGGENFDTGANASAEEAAEQLDDTKSQAIDVVVAFRLQKVEGVYNSLKDYQAQFKGYLKQVIAAKKEAGVSDEEVKKFQLGVQDYFTKTIKKNFKNYDFYTGESQNHDGILLLLNYREDGTTPYFTIWKHALKETRT